MVHIFLNNDHNVLNYIYDKYDGYDISYLQSEDISQMGIFKLYSSIDLFSNKKLIVVNNPLYFVNKSNALNKKEIEVFNDLVNVQTNNEVIFLISKELNKSISYVKDNLDKLDYKTNIVIKSEQMFFKNNNINIDSDALKYLKENISAGYNYQNELLKLSMFKDGAITINDINEHVSLKVDVDIFKLIENIILCNRQIVFEQYNELVLNGGLTQEQILTTMYSQLKFFISVKMLKVKMISDNDIANMLSCSYYRIKMSNKIINQTDLNSFISLHDAVANYDYLIKSGNTKQKDIVLNLVI